MYNIWQTTKTVSSFKASAEMFSTNTNRFFLLQNGRNAANLRTPICETDKTSDGGGRQKIRPMARNRLERRCWMTSAFKDWVTYYLHD